MKLTLTERVSLAVVGGGTLIAVTLLLTGGTLNDIIAFAAAFGIATLIPSPLEKPGKDSDE